MKLFPAACALFAFALDAGLATEFTVMNTDDDGPGSLRRAIADAQADSGDDVIVFSPDLDGVIVLTSGALQIDNAVTGKITVDASALGEGMVVALNDADSAPNIDDNFASEGNHFTAGNPMLGPGQENGGETLTFLPVFGSPLIDGGGELTNPPTTDQRGFDRPFNGVPDLGAVEVSFQPDARIGRRANPATHKIDDYYSAFAVGQLQRVKLKDRRKSKFHFSVENDGDIAAPLLVRGNRANKTLRLKVFRLTGGRVNVTGAIRRGYALGEVASGGTVVFRGHVKARSKKKRARQRLTFRAASGGTVLSDAVRAKVFQKR
ncbi:MAG: choice-of-anchor Q domain-containing protein [Verrucomicrobiales bacterium]